MAESKVIVKSVLLNFAKLKWKSENVKKYSNEICHIQLHIFLELLI